MTDIEAIRARHYQSEFYCPDNECKDDPHLNCGGCQGVGGDWPCDTAVVLAALEESRADREYYIRRVDVNVEAGDAARADADRLAEALRGLHDITVQSLALIDQHPSIPPSDSTVVLRAVALPQAKEALRQHEETTR